MGLDPRIFPKDFLWGVATSSYQIEGAVEEDGRGPSIWDTFSHTPGTIENGDTGDVACDHYHRYREDVALMRDLGAQAYRFSVAWSRVIPQGDGAVNQKGLDWYDQLVDELLKSGIQPFVTLYHWDLPQGLEDRGGWTVRSSADAFARYADIMTRRLGDRVKHWITHNEPWCTTFLGYHEGIFAPGTKDLKTALQVSHHLLLSHGLAVQAIKAASPDAKVGMAPNTEHVYPASNSHEDLAAARRWDGYFHRWFMDPLFGRGYPQDMLNFYGADAPTITPGDLDTIAQPIDFLGLNFYTRKVYAHDPSNAQFPGVRAAAPIPPEKLTDFGWEVYPQAMFDILFRLHHDYKLPAIYITENGAAYNDVVNAKGEVDDPKREAYLQAHFETAGKLVEAGVPLKGYFVWSLMDNFEWSRGYRLRFGIVYVDYKTQRRIVKRSGRWVRDWINKFKALHGVK
jgi:beta-glucosidase